jgi:hypothetical protein
MSNTVIRARMVGTWCMSVMSIGAASIVLGAGVTVPNGAVLLAACVVPPLVMLLVCRPVALTLPVERAG